VSFFFTIFVKKGGQFEKRLASSTMTPSRAASERGLKIYIIIIDL
jgi:hypothetical protein